MTLCIQTTIPHRGGLPHSDTWGSKLARSSPQIFAACHVLHRLLAPRHPPDALLILKHAAEASPPQPKPAMHRNHPHPNARMQTRTQSHSKAITSDVKADAEYSAHYTKRPAHYAQPAIRAAWLAPHRIRVRHPRKLNTDLPPDPKPPPPCLRITAVARTQPRDPARTERTRT